MARKRRGYPRLSKDASKAYVSRGGDDDRHPVDDETGLISDIDTASRRNSTSTIETTSESEEDTTPLFDVPPDSIFANDPPPKKKTKKSSSKKTKSTSAPTFVGRRLAKYFDDVLFLGTIVEAVLLPEGTTVWKVHYDDDDEEELELFELKEALVIYNLEGKLVDVKYSTEDAIASDELQVVAKSNKVSSTSSLRHGSTDASSPSSFTPSKMGKKTNKEEAKTQGSPLLPAFSSATAVTATTTVGGVSGNDKVIVPAYRYASVAGANVGSINLRGPSVTVSDVLSTTTCTTSARATTAALTKSKGKDKKKGFSLRNFISTKLAKGESNGACPGSPWGAPPGKRGRRNRQQQKKKTKVHRRYPSIPAAVSSPYAASPGRRVQEQQGKYPPPSSVPSVIGVPRSLQW